MRVIQINSVANGSTGKIMFSLSKTAEAAGFETCSITGKRKNVYVNKEDKASHLLVQTLPEYYITCILGRLTGKPNFVFSPATKRVIQIIRDFHPDIVHLHNIHGDFIQTEDLLSFLQKESYRIIWTLHDCWSFTGRCPHFQLCKCDKWKIGCGDCPYPKHDYPASYVDRTKLLWELKKKWFTGLKDLMIVTPSQWLANLVKESFLKEYPVKVINNGIDLTVFKPTESDFREKHHIPQDKKILLGVAFGWGVRKGLDVFIELSKRLPDNYQIVLVGTDDKVDKQLPGNIISIHRTQNQKQLAEIYSAADLFVNPTREEVLGMVNIESLACGTPVITFNTGGSPECIDTTCGSVVECDDVDSMELEIIRICEKEPYSQEACIMQAKQFDMNEKFQEYIDLYESNSE